MAVVVAFAVARRRLMLAGVSDQFDDIFDTAVDTSIDLVSFVAPDGRASLLGDVLASLGLDGVLVESFADGRQTWVAPYIGVLVPVFFGVVLLTRRLTLTPNPRLPPGYLRWLTIVTVASIVLALGPVLHVARVASPDAQVASPLLSLLWTATPLRWIRYPWTWAHLTHVALLLTFAALMPALLRRRRAWSPSLLLLVALLAVEFVSPQVLEAFHSPHPSAPGSRSHVITPPSPASSRPPCPNSPPHCARSTVRWPCCPGPTATPSRCSGRTPAHACATWGSTATSTRSRRWRPLRARNCAVRRMRRSVR